mgnify:FL=1
MYFGLLFQLGIIKISQKFAIIMFFISMIALTFESTIVRSNNWNLSYDMYIFIIPASIFLFAIAIAITFSNVSLCKSLRDQGTLVFYLHTIVGFGVENLQFNKNIQNNSLGKFLMILIISNMIAFIVRKVSNIERFKVIRKIYK